MLPCRLSEWAGRQVWFQRRSSFAFAAAGVETVADDDGRGLDAAFADGIVELYLYEGGGMARLLAEVGHVLRADEREAAATWASGRHDLYEVLEGGDRLCAVRTGEVREAKTVVALETTLVAHGFPPGEGVAVGLASEAAVGEAGAVRGQGVPRALGRPGRLVVVVTPRDEEAHAPIMPW